MDASIHRRGIPSSADGAEGIQLEGIKLGSIDHAALQISSEIHLPAYQAETHGGGEVTSEELHEKLDKMRSEILEAISRPNAEIAALRQEMSEMRSDISALARALLPKSLKDKESASTRKDKESEALTAANGELSSASASPASELEGGSKK